MRRTRDITDFAFGQIRLVLIGVIGLMGAHRVPVLLTQTIAKKARQQLAGIEALLRRLLLLMALELEHELIPDMRETNGFLPNPDIQRAARPKSWSLFQPGGSGYLPDFDRLPPPRRGWSLPLAAPIVARIKLLQNIVDAPETFARRMAFHLTRQRQDQEAFLPYTNVNLRRLGTELSTLYQFLAASVMEAIFARPPRVGPRPRPPPRIRLL